MFSTVPSTESVKLSPLLFSLLIKIEKRFLRYAWKCVLSTFWFLSLSRGCWTWISLVSTQQNLFHTCSSLQAQTHKPRDSQIISFAIDEAPTLHNPAVPPPREASRTSLMVHGKRPGWMQRSVAPPCHDKCDDFPKSWWAVSYSPEHLGIDDPFPVEEMDCALMQTHISTMCSWRPGLFLPNLLPQHLAHGPSDTPEHPQCARPWVNKADTSCLHDAYRLAEESEILPVITNV